MKICGGAWRNLSRYFDETQYDYSIKFAKAMASPRSMG